MKSLVLLFFTICLYTLSHAQFGRQSIHPAATAGDNISLVDLDNDNDLDLLCGNIRWYENNGSGQFLTEHIIIDTTASNFDYEISSSGFTHGDFDNDNDEDIIGAFHVTRFSSPFGPFPETFTHLFYFENLGAGSFAPPIVLDSTLGFNSNKSSLHTVDIDIDGNLDFVFISEYFDNFVYPFVGAGNGTFAHGSELSDHFNSNNGKYFGAMQLTSFDFEGDGDHDLVIGDSRRDFIIQKNPGLITNSLNYQIFTLYPFTFPQLEQWEIRNIDHMDVNGDGWEDVVLVKGSGTHSNRHRIHWRKNLNGAGFDSARVITTNSGGSYIADNVSNIKCIDLDSDGDKDFIVAKRSGNNLGWVENLGNGNFASFKKISTRSNATVKIISGDVDGDGDIDIVLDKDIGGKPTIYENFRGNNFSFSGEVFHDANQNKQKDAGEAYLPLVRIEASPGNAVAYSNGEPYQINTDTGTYTISYTNTANWVLTTDFPTYTRTVNSQNPKATNLDFGFVPINPSTYIEASLNGGQPRCGRKNNYWINFNNLGTTIPSGRIVLTLSDSVSYLSSQIVPDSINGQTIYWNYNSLSYFSSEKLNLVVQMPSSFSIGDTLTSVLSIEELNSGNTVLYRTSDTLKQVLTCNSNTNDKEVEPKGHGAQGLITTNQRLEYTIRFQNTGNSTATDVTIIDQLSSHLEIGTFHVIGSSHKVNTSINSNGELKFYFEDIMLPDSSTNETESHGFIKFFIYPKSTLLSNAVIKNYAKILFDSDLLISTDTVVNTITAAVPTFVVGAVSNNISCNGLNDGVANAHAVGGVTPYTYVWSNGVTTSTNIGLSAGVYTVTVTDNTGLSATASTNLAEPSALTTTLNVTDVDCFNQGSIALTVNGGTPPYQYAWSNSATSANITNLSVGTYTVTVTDNNNCIAIQSGSIQLDCGKYNLRLSGNYCTQTGVDPSNNLMHIDTHPLATNYRVRVNGSGVPNFVYTTTRDRFNLYYIPGMQYGQSYTVEVAGFINGQWTNYGTPCTITTGNISSLINLRLTGPYCNATNLDPTNSLLHFTSRSDATNYRVRVNGSGVPNFVYTTTQDRFNFYFIPGMQYGQSYTVEIAAFINGQWSNYGTPCTITTGSIANLINLRLTGPYCNATNLNPLNSLLHYTSRSDATNYRVRVNGSGVSNFVYTTTRDRFNFYYITGMQYNQSYTVEVAAFINGQWSNYGTPCTITTGSPPSLSPPMSRIRSVISNENDTSIDFSMYPNPSHNKIVTIKYNNVNAVSDEVVTIEIYDVKGKRILKKWLHTLNGELTTEINRNRTLKPGIYFIRLENGNKLLSEKLVIQ